MRVPAPPEAATAFTGKGAYALSQLYYYLAAIVAVGFVIGGTIAALIALRQLAWPDPGGVTRTSLETLLHGLAFAVPAAVAAWWHLRQAREREGQVMPGVFWGRSLYFHGVAFVTFVIALSGMAAALFSFVDAVVAPRCPTGFISIDCTDTGAAVRAATNGLIVVLVAGVIWWWHLREGRRAVTPDPDASVPMMGVS